MTRSAVTRLGSALCAAALIAACGGTPSNLGGRPEPEPRPPRAGPVDDRGLDPCADPLEYAFTPSAIAPPAADAGHTPLVDPARQALLDSVTAATAGRNAEAVARADAAGYALCLATGGVRLWQPAAAVDGPTLAWRADARRGVLLEVPHPFFERDSLARARTAFLAHDVHALLVSGTHRCASTTASPCSGRTEACDDDKAAFRASDPAHAIDTAFHALHRTLSALHPRAVVVGVHNMRAPGVSLSDGTRLRVERSSPVRRAADAIERTLPGLMLTACNPGAGVPVEERHCGLTDVSGRALNGSTDACRVSPERSTGRFLHLEWNKDLSRVDADTLLDAVIYAVGEWDG